MGILGFLSGPNRGFSGSFWAQSGIFWFLSGPSRGFLVSLWARKKRKNNTPREARGKKYMCWPATGERKARKEQKQYPREARGNQNRPRSPKICLFIYWSISWVILAIPREARKNTNRENSKKFTKPMFEIHRRNCPRPSPSKNFLKSIRNPRV